MNLYMVHSSGLLDINILLLHSLMFMKLSFLDAKCEKRAVSFLVRVPVGSLEIFK